MIILQVEDTPSDAALTEFALRKIGGAHTVIVVEDGLAAMRFLMKEAPYESAPRPNLILLDSNLPGLSGHDVLKRIKGDPTLRTIPVVMFSTSTATETRNIAYEMYANSFVVKPIEAKAFIAAVSAILSYWTGTTALPGTA